jgi:hypothetical protein
MKFRADIIISPALNQQLRSKTGALGQFVQEVMDQTKSVAAKNTPKQSGSASRAWQIQGRGIDTTVENNKPYIERLEAGSSRQAPRGILKPTLQEIRRRRIVK